MATIFDTKQDTKTAVMDRAAVEHNALIKERYQRLQSLEETQIAEALYQAPKASVLAPERPAQAQSPVQHVQERDVSSVFTVETLDRTLQSHAPVAEVAPVVEVLPVAQTPVEIKAQEVQKIELSRFAKVFMCACAAVVTLLLCLICVFTQVISAKQVELSALEGRTAQLREEYSRIVSEKEEIMTDMEAIEEYAHAHGMIKR